MADFGKSLASALLPILLVTITWLFFSLLANFVPVALPYASILHPLHFLFFLLAGYRAARRYRLGLFSSGLASFFAAFLSGIALFVLTFLLVLGGLAAGIAEDRTGLVAAGSLNDLSILVPWFFQLLVAALTNLIVGAMGGFIGQKL